MKYTGNYNIGSVNFCRFSSLAKCLCNLRIALVALLTIDSFIILGC
jgi:hypothetical protein